MNIWADRRRSLASQARSAFQMSGFDRTGGKQNRRQQMARACFVCDWVQRHCGTAHLGQLGGRQVVQFWQAHRDHADRTSHGYWRALCSLWQACGKAGLPPRPLPIERGTTKGTEI